MNCSRCSWNIWDGCLTQPEKSGKVHSREKDQSKFWSMTRKWGKVMREENARRHRRMWALRGLMHFSILFLYKICMGGLKGKWYEVKRMHESGCMYEDIKNHFDEIVLLWFYWLIYMRCYTTFKNDKLWICALNFFCPRLWMYYRINKREHGQFTLNSSDRTNQALLI